MGDTKISVFPSSKNEALTMLYLNNQDLSSKTPEEVVNMYYDVYDKIKAQSEVNRKLRKDGNMTFA